MNPAQLRLDLLAALEENGRSTTSELIAFVRAEDHGLGYEEVKVALDGLLEAELIVWEAGGDHLWRVSPQGRDYLATART